jgi:hypothetical protein
MQNVNSTNSVDKNGVYGSLTKKGLSLLLCLLQAVGLMAFWQKFAAVIDKTRSNGPA